MNNIKKKKNAVPNFLGPVDNLESYVKADWWKEIFNANYLRTDGDVVENQLVTELEAQIFTDILQPDKHSAILDLCCGQGRHTLELARRGYRNITGLDRSHYLITRAKNINRSQGGLATFKEGDARKLPFGNDTFDFVIIPGNSFGYFESAADDQRVLSEVKRVLKPNGRLLIDITDGSYMRKNFQPRSWEWIDNQYFVCRERELSSDKQRLISREVITHVTKGIVADQFYAERLYTTQSITKLLDETGFKAIVMHDDYFTKSTRNQDLGMMAKRMLISGKVIKEWTPVRLHKNHKVRVAVLLGDPRMKDTVKPNGQFDEDDIYTINALKKALTQLNGMHFRFYDNHLSMMQDLTRDKKDIDLVFNLCDEGFSNEARKELHVPAMLEMLELPYTGGNPQCLAYCYDKSLVRGIAKEMDIPVPEGFVIKPEDTVFFDLPLPFPVIVKPNFGDSSIGINQYSVCHEVNALENAIIHARESVGYDEPILVEQYLTGKDVSVGIIGNPPESYNVLPVIREDYSLLPEGLPHICGYEAKWDPQSPYWKIRSLPAGLEEATERYLVASCLKLFQRLECRDYARFDWRLDDNGTPRLLEANPNPGWCWDGHLAKMAGLAEIPYSAMLGDILMSAIQRLKIKADLREGAMMALHHSPSSN